MENGKKEICLDTNPAGLVTITSEIPAVNGAVQKYAKKDPRIQIKATPKTNGGYLLAWIPQEYIQIRKPLVLSEEQKEKKREQMRKNFAKTR